MKTINKDTAKKHIYKTNGKFFSAVFIKKNGDKRFIHCMTKSKKGVKGVGLKYNPDKVNNVIVKDLKIHQFRTINVDTLIELNAGGVKYKVEGK
jgi:hypothetical protein